MTGTMDIYAYTVTAEIFSDVFLSENILMMPADEIAMTPSCSFPGCWPISETNRNCTVSTLHVADRDDAERAVPVGQECTLQCSNNLYTASVQ